MEEDKTKTRDAPRSHGIPGLLHPRIALRPTFEADKLEAPPRRELVSYRGSVHDARARAGFGVCFEEDRKLNERDN
jgi:hypothetical protein